MITCKKANSLLMCFTCIGNTRTSALKNKLELVHLHVHTDPFLLLISISQSKKTESHCQDGMKPSPIQTKVFTH